MGSLNSRKEIYGVHRESPFILFSCFSFTLRLELYLWCLLQTTIVLCWQRQVVTWMKGDWRCIFDSLKIDSLPLTGFLETIPSLCFEYYCRLLCIYWPLSYVIRSHMCASAMSTGRWFFVFYDCEGACGGLQLHGWLSAYRLFWNPYDLWFILLPCLLVLVYSDTCNNFLSSLWTFSIWW